MVKMGNFVRHVLPQLKINFKMQEIKCGEEYKIVPTTCLQLCKIILEKHSKILPVVSVSPEGVLFLLFSIFPLSS